MNKKCLAFLLSVSLVCLSAAASAETIAAQIDAPKNCQAVFTSSSGKTQIEVNAVVTIPKVSQIELIPVACRTFSQEDVHALASIVSQQGIWEEEENSTASFYFYQLKSKDAKDNCCITVGEEYHVSPTKAAYGASLTFKLEHDIKRTGAGGVNYLPGESLPIHGAGIEGHPLTTQAAVACADEFLQKVTSDFFHIASVGQVSGFLLNDELGNPTSGAAYQITYTREIAGVPLLYVHEMMWEDDELYTIPVGYETIQIIIDEQGRVCHFSWMHPYEINGEAEKAPALLSFDAMLQSAKAVMPLTLAYSEKDGNAEILIDRIELEYMPVLQRENAEQFSLTPVWNFYGTGEMPYFHCTMQDYCWLTLNAIDGTVIDRSYGY